MELTALDLRTNDMGMPQRPRRTLFGASVDSPTSLEVKGGHLLGPLKKPPGQLQAKLRFASELMSDLSLAYLESP